MPRSPSTTCCIHLAVLRESWKTLRSHWRALRPKWRPDPTSVVGICPAWFARFPEESLHDLYEDCSGSHKKKPAGPVKPQEWRANAQEAMAWLGKEDERQKERFFWYGGAGWELKCLYLCLCGCTANIFWPEHRLHGHSHEELWKWICRLRCQLVGWGVPGPVEEFSWGRRGRALPFLALVLWPGNRNIFRVLMVTAKSVLLRVTNGYYI